MRATPEAMPAGKRLDESHAGGEACGEGRWWLTQPHMQWKETKTKKKGIMEKKTVVIIHFNTPELTEAAIRSLRKHGGEDYKVVVFDNSTDVDFPSIDGLPSRKMKARPFVVPRGKAREVLGDVKVINNRKGKVIDFQKLLAEYEAWCCERDYPQEQAADMLHVMRRLGYDLHTHGLFQGCFEIVRKNRVNQLINDITYDLLRYVASDGKMQRISQTWFSMVVNHLFSDKLNVMAVSQDIITDGRLMQWCRHGTQEAIKIEPSIAPIMFGHKVDVWKVNP